MRYEADFDTSGSDFTWSVARAGYSLVEKSYKFQLSDAIEVGELPFSERKGLAFLQVGPSGTDIIRSGGDLRAFVADAFTRYRPRDRAALHREFADCDSQPEAALRFVNQYGLVDSRPWFPSFLEDFYSYQALIRDILALAKRQRASNGKVQTVINRNRAHFYLRVTPTGTGKLTHRVLPETLLGWMLLQSVHELTGTTFRDCEVCGTPIEILNGRQDRKRFCSDRCRLKHHREQRRR